MSLIIKYEHVQKHHLSVECRKIYECLSGVASLNQRTISKRSFMEGYKMIYDYIVGSSDIFARASMQKTFVIVIRELCDKSIKQILSQNNTSNKNLINIILEISTEYLHKCEMLKKIGAYYDRAIKTCNEHDKYKYDNARTQCITEISKSFWHKKLTSALKNEKTLYYDYKRICLILIGLKDKESIFHTLPKEVAYMHIFPYITVDFKTENKYKLLKTCLLDPSYNISTIIDNITKLIH